MLLGPSDSYATNERLCNPWTPENSGNRRVFRLKQGSCPISESMT